MTTRLIAFGAARTAAREAAGTRPTPSTTSTLDWIDTRVAAACAAAGPTLDALVAELEGRAAVLNPSRSRSVAALLAAAQALVTGAAPTCPAVPATLWVMVHDSYDGQNLFAVTGDGRRFMSAYSLGDRRHRPKLRVDDSVDANSAAVETTRQMELDGYALLGRPARGRLVDVGRGSLAALVLACTAAGWPPPDRWPPPRPRTV